MSEGVRSLGFGGRVWEETVGVWDVFVVNCDDP